jgi:CDP-paratose synthetase
VTTVLVTGSTGFLGSSIVRRFIAAGYSVIGLKRSTSDTWRIVDYLDRMEMVDIDQCTVSDIFSRHSIDVVVHAATSYGRSEESLSEIVYANLYLPLKILEAGIVNGITAFLNTDTFYNVQTVLPFGLHNYVRSKKDFIAYAHQLAKKNRVRFLSLRIEHMYGPGDAEGKFLPWLIQTFLQGKSEMALTLGEQKRDLIHVDDVAHAFEILIEKHAGIEVFTASFEVGSGKAILLRELIENIHYLCSAKTILKFGALEYREGEIMSSHADLRALSGLGWKPLIDLESGLEKTIHFEKKRLEQV